MIHLPDQIIVVDLDGTLADCSHREHLAQAGQWEEFHDKLMEDLLHRDTFEFIMAMQELFYIWIVTARPERYRGRTTAWLQAHQIFPEQIIMRPNDNFQKSEELKIHLLECELGSKEQVLDNVLLCLDDREKCVEALRNYGLKCWQVRNGAY